MKRHLTWLLTTIYFFPLFAEEQMTGATGTAEPALSPPPPPIISYEGTFIKMFLALLGLVLLIFFSVWALRRLSKGKWGMGGHHKQITVLERHPISPKSMLYLIEISGKKVVIAESQLEIKKIATLDSIQEEQED